LRKQRTAQEENFLGGSLFFTLKVLRFRYIIEYLRYFLKTKIKRNSIQKKAQKN